MKSKNLFQLFTKKITLLTFFTLFSTLTILIAAPTAQSDSIIGSVNAQSTGNVTITELRYGPWYSGKKVGIRVSTSTPCNFGPDGSTYDFIHLDLNHLSEESQKAYMSMLLTAYSTQKTVVIYYYNNDSVSCGFLNLTLK